MSIILILVLLILLQVPLLYYFPSAPLLQNRSYDVGIVLGCPSQEDGSMSQTQKSRMNKAISLYQQGIVSNLIISGAGVKSTYVEAEVMAAYAIELGIPSTHVLLEKSAKNTYDNLKNTEVLCKQHSFVSVVVITSKFHIRRSNFFVKKFFQNYAMCPSEEPEKAKHYIEEYVRMWNTLRIEWILTYQKKRS